MAGNSEKTGGRQPGPGRKFMPGQSGNPSGRPKLPEDYKIAIEGIGRKALAALENIVESPNHPRHEQAVEYAINRWQGTPTTRSEVSGPGGGPVTVERMTTEEARTELAALLASAARQVAEEEERQAIEDESDNDGAAES